MGIEEMMRLGWWGGECGRVESTMLLCCLILPRLIALVHTAIVGDTREGYRDDTFQQLQDT